MPRRKTLSDDEVLDAAMRVMFRAGPADFTFAAVAAEAGIAPATLVQRFGDKRSLVLKVIERDNRQFAETLKSLPKGKGTAAVLTLFNKMMEGYEEADAAEQLLWLREDFRDPEFNKLTRARFKLVRRAIAERLPPLHMPPAQAAKLIEAQWNGSLIQCGLEGGGRLAPRVIARLKLLLRALGA